MPEPRGSENPMTNLIEDADFQLLPEQQVLSFGQQNKILAYGPFLKYLLL